MAKKILVGLVLGVFFLTGFSSTKAEQVITLKLRAEPENYAGQCPARVSFLGEIKATKPGKVQYRFIRSDGALAMVETLEFDRPGVKPVGTSWDLDADYSGWMAIQVLYPVELESNRVNFKISCLKLEKPPLLEKPLIVKVPKPEIKEDCISFNHQTTVVKNISGRWKIVDGDHWLFDFGSKKSEADRALSIIHYYGLNKTCYVGRPDPSFEYLLSSNRAPEGIFSGEDCVGFSPERAEVKNIGGRWKIVDGEHWLFDFEDKESEARDALSIIKNYQFTNSCFVGRPDPSFKYLRK